MDYSKRLADLEQTVGSLRDAYNWIEDPHINNPTQKDCDELRAMWRHCQLIMAELGDYWTDDACDFVEHDENRKYCPDEHYMED